MDCNNLVFIFSFKKHQCLSFVVEQSCMPTIRYEIQFAHCQALYAHRILWCSLWVFASQEQSWVVELIADHCLLGCILPSLAPHSNPLMDCALCHSMGWYSQVEIVMTLLMTGALMLLMTGAPWMLWFRCHHSR